MKKKVHICLKWPPRPFTFWPHLCFQYDPCFFLSSYKENSVVFPYICHVFLQAAPFSWNILFSSCCFVCVCARLCKMIYFIYQQHGVKKPQLQVIFLGLEPVSGHLCISAPSLVPGSSLLLKPPGLGAGDGLTSPSPCSWKGKMCLGPSPGCQSPGPLGEEHLLGPAGTRPREQGGQDSRCWHTTSELRRSCMVNPFKGPDPFPKVQPNPRQVKHSHRPAKPRKYLLPAGRRVGVKEVWQAPQASGARGRKGRRRPSVGAHHLGGHVRVGLSAGRRPAGWLEAQVTGQASMRKCCQAGMERSSCSPSSQHPAHVITSQMRTQLARYPGCAGPLSRCILLFNAVRQCSSFSAWSGQADYHCPAASCSRLRGTCPSCSQRRHCCPRHVQLFQESCYAVPGPPKVRLDFKAHGSVKTPFRAQKNSLRA